MLLLLLLLLLLLFLLVTVFTIFYCIFFKKKCIYDCLNHNLIPNIIKVNIKKKKNQYLFDIDMYDELLRKFLRSIFFVFKNNNNKGVNCLKFKI